MGKIIINKKTFFAVIFIFILLFFTKIFLFLTDKIWQPVVSTINMGGIQIHTFAKTIFVPHTWQHPLKNGIHHTPEGR